MPFASLSSSSSKSRKNSRAKYFVTRPALFSVELNAHYLTYLIILVQQQQLPPEVLTIHLFSSQTCESFFRNTRSLSGVFSTTVNYTVEDFLRRSKKISILNTIKCQDKATSLMKFPIHHKHLLDNVTGNNQHLIDVSNLDIESVVLQAYQSALHLTKSLNILSVSYLSTVNQSFNTQLLF